MNPGEYRVPTAQDVWRAHQRIRPWVFPAPLVPSLPLGRVAGGRVALQLEFVNPVGSFKIRGAAHALVAQQRAGKLFGVATFSTGNHGTAVAYMAQRLGVPARVFLPTTVPAVKVAQLQQWGAQVTVSGKTQEDAARRCQEAADAEGLLLVPPFDDADVIAGQGTAGWDLMNRWPDVDTVLVPVSGGGLLSGVALAVKAVHPAARVIGVGARHAGSMAASVRAGRPVDAPEAPTWADSLLGGVGGDNRFTLGLVRHWVDDLVEVSEEEIVDALCFLLEHHRLIVEGAAAVGVAALLTGRVTVGASTAVLLTGNVVEVNRVMQAWQARSEAAPTSER